MKSINQVGPDGSAGFLSLRRWLVEAHVSPVTAWRWRKRGWLNVVNIAGRLYITRNEIERFTRLAEGGEFAALHPVPESKNREHKEVAHEP